MHFLITGHTGFKGSWLSLMLHQRGHIVSGIALEPEKGSLFEVADLSRIFKHDIRCDIRQLENLQRHIIEINPNVVIHLAAQALVRTSYANPLETFEVNAIGTINLLKATQSLSNLYGQLIVTTDKVYRNTSKGIGYIESDSLGGSDPYSASKAMADIGAQGWIRSFTNAPTAIARAGNVIGGGDISSDRLIPDLVRSFQDGLSPRLRFPNAIRPWQHVLDCLNGYLLLIDELIAGKGLGEWNFGPTEGEIRTVSEVASLAAEIWGVRTNWEKDLGAHPEETSLLLLNSDKARHLLGWREKLDFNESIMWTMDWYKKVANGADPFQQMILNLNEFEDKI